MDGGLPDAVQGRSTTKKLHSGPQLPKKEKSFTGREKWSTTKLYDLEVIDSKIVEDQLFVKVHYTEEPWKTQFYDTWRDARDIVDIPHTFVNTSQEERTNFIELLRISLKENLHGQRKVDSVVNIELPISKGLFSEISSLGRKSKTNHYLLPALADFNNLLGKGWSFRIINPQGDFSSIEPGTVSFWLTERRPLEEYQPDGGIKLLHRGFRFHLKFARNVGNKYDFQQFAIP